MFSMKISSKKEESKPTVNKHNPPSNVFGNLDEPTVSSQSLSKRQLINREAKNKKNKRELAKLMKSNPSVFQYDELYDTFEAKKKESFRQKELEKTLRPVRYMDRVQQVAQERKVRHDAAHERLLLKERKETDHLFVNKQKYITRAYKTQLKEIEQQRLQDKIQSHKEKTVRDDPQMFGFFNDYLQNKTSIASDVSIKKQTQTKDKRSRSRSRSRSRERNGNQNELSEEHKFHIERHQKELSKATFDEKKQKQMEQIALQKCTKRTTKSDLQSLRERYSKRKSLKQSSGS
eukprot:67237_1